MKYIIMLILAASIACAEMPAVKFYATAITNAAAVTANSDVKTRGVSGWVDTLVLDLSGYASPTVTVSVTASGPLGSRTIFSKADVTADATFPLRDIVCTQVGVDIANTPARVPLLDDILTFSIFAANVTNSITGSAYLIMSQHP